MSIKWKVCGLYHLVEEDEDEDTKDVFILEDSIKDAQLTFGIIGVDSNEVKYMGDYNHPTNLLPSSDLQMLMLICILEAYFFIIFRRV